MDGFSIAITALSAVCSVLGAIAPQPFAGIAQGLVAVLGGLAALAAGHQHATTPPPAPAPVVLGKSSSALVVKPAPAEPPEDDGPYVYQAPPDPDDSSQRGP